jgi:FkbM family methyltransferase
LKNYLPNELDFESGDITLESFNKLDGYYLIYPGENFPNSKFLFDFNLERITKNDRRFLGYLCDFTNIASPGMETISSLDFLRKIKKGKKIGLVNFFSTKLEMFMFKHLQPFVFSFICALNSRDTCHTYLKVSEERLFVKNNLDRYEEVIKLFQDETSKNMMSARLKSIAKLDLTDIINNYLPIEYEYFNDSNESFSLKLREKEIYVDVGASWGDCVQKFFGMVNNPSDSMAYAFEPNEIDFNRLNKLKYFLPLIPSKSFVSSKSENIKFKTNLENLHGSGISSEGKDSIAVSIDDVVPNATFIKIDAEGSEPQILKGATRNLTNPECRLAVCVYHYPEDLFEVFKTMKQLGRSEFFYRQYHPSLWDGVLYYA